MTKIVVIEDDQTIVKGIEDTLQFHEYKVYTASTGKEGLEKIKKNIPDLVILDIMLPDLDGFEICKKIKTIKDIPVIMLTAKSQESDKLLGFEVGADDYITKPFSVKELVARIRAVLRRADATVGGGEVVRAGAVEIDIPKRRVVVAGTEAELTASEFDILLTLAQQPGRIYTRAQLLDAVRGVSFDSYERAIDAHVKNIRRKIEPDPKHPAYVLTVYGVGYIFADA